MIRTVSIIAALAALATPAFASDIKISLNGKDNATIQADIVSAATLACRDVELIDYLGRTRAMCVTSTIKETQDKVAAIMSSAPKNTLASR